jgi:hypothetical protein
VTAAVFWDGIGGAIIGALIGGLVSVFVAVLVVRLTHKGDDERALETESRTAAGELTVGLVGLRHAAGVVAKVGSREERMDRRRDINTDAAMLFLLHRPSLRLASLRADAERANQVVMHFLNLGQKYDDETLFTMPVRIGATFSAGDLDTWHRPAHRALGEYLADFAARLAQHRMGERVDEDPLPEPEWPPLTPPPT